MEGDLKKYVKASLKEEGASDEEIENFIRSDAMESVKSVFVTAPDLAQNW